MQFLRDVRLFVAETLEFFNDKGHLRVFALLIAIVGVTTLCSAGANGSLRDDGWTSDWLQNFSTEMLGAVVTFVLFVGYIESRQNKMTKQAEDDQRRIAREAEEEAEKKRLILQMGSPFNEFAVEAARALKARGWGFGEDESLHRANLDRANLHGVRLWFANLQEANLKDTNLQGAGLERSNLQGADLEGAILQDANLLEANLQMTNLSGAILQESNLARADLQAAKLEMANLERADMGATNLKEANLGFTNLQGANLGASNLQDANLSFANLEGANLVTANLQGANLLAANLQRLTLGTVNLKGANLEAANLQGANFYYTVGGELLEARLDDTTTLPNGSKYEPERGINQLECFTNPNHHDFWPPSDVYLRWHKLDDEP